MRIREHFVIPCLLLASISCGSLHAQTPSVLTWHNDNSRDGLNSQETSLTLGIVKSKTFGRIGFFAADGKVDAQPLFVPGLTINGQVHNVLFIATENDSVYARDAVTGEALWRTSLLQPGEVASDDRGCSQVTPTIGVTSTPVIDLTRAGGVLYVVSASKQAGTENYHQRLNALSLRTGAQMLGGPTEIAATYPGTGASSSNGKVVFAPSQYLERAALLEWQGQIFTSWGSHCDNAPYTGWVMGYDANTLQQTSVLNLTPNGSDGAIWMSGAGPAANAKAMVFLDGNGTFDPSLDSLGFPLNRNFGNAFLQLTLNGSALQVADYYASDSTVYESSRDLDLGSGGAMLLPTQVDSSGIQHSLAVGAGKDGNIYLVDLANMGKFRPNGGNIYQYLGNALPSGAWSSPAFFRNTVYYGGVDDNLQAFTVANAKLVATPASKSPNGFGYPGPTPSISSNGLENGIVWAVQYSGSVSTLYAYNAENLSIELWNSNQAGTRDQFGSGAKFATPTIVNGHVCVGAANGVAVFGVLSQ